MSKVTYEKFYFRPIDDELRFEVIEEYFEENNNRGKYDGEMFCPGCRIPELKFVPRGATHRAYLSAINADLHLPGCDYKYDVSSTRNTKAYFERLSDAQVKDKLASMLRSLNRNGTRTGNAHANYLQRADDNPFILTSDDNRGSRVRRTLPRRNLDRALKKEDVDLLCAFYARNAYLHVEIKEHVNKLGEQYKLNYLHIKTTTGKRYRIYRGTHKDEVIPDRQYNVVLIGMFSEKTLPYSTKHINLIDHDTRYGSKPNQYAIKIE